MLSKRQNKPKGEEGGCRKKELDKRDVGGVESSVGEFLESSFANDRRGSLGPPLPFLAS